ncbi:TetR/AcrR family transcriptional regulator [Kocuria rhizophila]|uniref:TetR/AcrR family transcriptional regulator n=1 Tax=Kocuria rhizophila TaxID=72000 RepID=UPI0025B1679F|nr:TetR/AcrR family transcriptional regulator [Kocuria rhizophila]MDN3226026.1 TetR/AcrR family transcriptional regulator [Kocuria rhizophila]
MTTKPEILDRALDVLRAGDALTLDAVARAVGITQPGVVHHFPTKDQLSVAVVDHLLDHWEAELTRRTGPDPDAVARLRAYVEFALLSELDPADLAVLADSRLRPELAARWTERMSAWFGESDRPNIVAARLVADGAWIDRCLGMLDLDEEHRRAVVDVTLGLVGDGPAAEGLGAEGADS